MTQLNAGYDWTACERIICCKTVPENGTVAVINLNWETNVVWMWVAISWEQCRKTRAWVWLQYQTTCGYVNFFFYGDFYFCKSYWDLLSMGHETGQDCVTDCKAFSTLQNNTGILFSLEEGCFYLETEWFLPIIGDKSRRSDWNLWV